MRRPVLQVAVLAVIFFFVGIGTAAIVLAAIPDPGSGPAVFDDFNWSSTANGFWHVNAIGASAQIKHGTLTLRGHSIELDHRLQTDPRETDIVAKVRASQFHRFALGLGVYHAGAVGLEFDDDGVKCGRGTDFGWKVDFMKGWKSLPKNQWFYLAVAVKNPYPNSKDLERAEKQLEKHGKKLAPVTVTCSMYDSAGRLISSVTPSVPPPNAHYVGFDETYLRTWDSGNEYQIDWFYAGPPAGVPSGPAMARG